jgi:hypothetical protein
LFVEPDAGGALTTGLSRSASDRDRRTLPLIAAWQKSGRGHPKPARNEIRELATEV